MDDDDGGGGGADNEDDWVTALLLRSKKAKPNEDAYYCFQVVKSLLMTAVRVMTMMM
jgi:hypothetical protein